MEVRDLIIMRHAKSDWSHEHSADFDRPLNKRGERDAPRMAKWMTSVKLVPDLLICSPALRARQTATEIINGLDLTDEVIIYDQRMYLASTDTLVNIIRETENKFRAVMLIGHNPGLENLAVELCNDDLLPDQDGGLMTTANIIHLRLHRPWENLERHSCEFVQIMRPKQLP